MGVVNSFSSSPSVGAVARRLAVGDFNRDGKQDLAVATSSNSVTVLGMG